SLHCTLLFLTDPAPTQIYTLSLHDALPISRSKAAQPRLESPSQKDFAEIERSPSRPARRSTSARIEHPSQTPGWFPSGRSESSLLLLRAKRTATAAAMP